MLCVFYTFDTYQDAKIERILFWCQFNLDTTCKFLKQTSVSANCTDNVFLLSVKGFWTMKDFFFISERFFNVLNLLYVRKMTKLRKTFKYLNSICISIIIECLNSLVCIYLFIIICKKYLHTVCTPTKSSTQSAIQKNPKILRNMFVTHWEMQHDAMMQSKAKAHVDMLTTLSH